MINKDAAIEEIFPAGISRIAVLRFFESNFISAILLKPMDAERAPVMAIKIQKISEKETEEFLNDKTTAERAKGSAKTVWENLIILR